MMKSFKVMLKQNNRQMTRLNQYAGAARFAYNWALGRQMDSFRAGNGLIKASDLRKELTVLKKQPGNEWIYTVSNDVLKQAVKDLDRAYSRFFIMKKDPDYKPYSKKKRKYFKRTGKKLTYYDSNGHPKFKRKKDADRCGFYQDTAKIRFTDTHVFIEGLSGSRRKNRLKQNWIRLADKGRIPVGARYQNPRVTFDGLNWYVSVSVDVPDIRENTGSETDGIGVDLGIKKAAVCSDGTTYDNINRTGKVRKLEKKKRRLKRQASRKYEMNRKGESYCKTANIGKLENRIRRLENRLK